jgi:hypothetical protein
MFELFRRRMWIDQIVHRRTLVIFTWRAQAVSATGGNVTVVVVGIDVLG